MILLSSLTLSGVSTEPASAELPTWSVATMPNVGSNTNEITGVSCATDTTCVAVGYSIDAAGRRRTLAETLQGTTWSIASTPNSGALANGLAGVSCTSATTCVAVGSAFNGTSLVTLIETWNGTTWSITPSPNRGTKGNELVAVSCASTTSCVAVGYYTDAVGTVRTLVETLQGSSWSTTTAPSPGLSTALLNGVSCTDTTNCVAVGYSVDGGGHPQSLVETRQGTTWSVTPTPSPSPGASLNSVSCGSATNCVAVGWTGDLFRQTLIERWNGTAWAVASSPNPVGARASYLRSVSCTTAARCIAVGSTYKDPTTKALIAAWNGAAWTMLPGPSLTGTENSLLGVSCASATACVTAGHRRTGAIARTLALSGSASPDVTAPTVTLSTPVPDGYYVVGQTAAASYTCRDETGGSGTVSCEGTVATATPIDTTSAGVEPFSVTGTDDAGNSSTSTTTYTVVDPTSASTVLPAGGGTVTTDAGAGPTPSAPLATTVTSPNEGTVTIDQGAVTIARPSGFSLLGVQADVVAPTASSAVPLTLVFDVDAAMLPSGTTKDTLSLLHDAALVPDCPAATTVPDGIDACISDRADAPSGGGDARLTVVSVSAGKWNLAAGGAVPPRISIGNGSVVEGSSGTTLMQLAVSLSAPSTSPVTVHYASADGTAKAGSDYVAASGTLTFPPGEDHALVPVSVNGNTTVEPDEIFTMNLSSPSGATIGDGIGAGTIIDDDATAPTAPRSLRAVPDNAGALLQWTAPVSKGGRPIVGYVVTPYVGGVAGTPRAFTTAATSQPVRALANGTTYTFDVAAINSVGTGARSAKSAAITVGAPVAPVVKAVSSSTQAVVTWNAPVNNGFAVTSYVVRVYRAGVLISAKTHTVTCTQPCTPARTWTVTGLTNGTNYTFTVEAHNSQGAGPRGTTTILVSATPTAPGRPGTPIARAGAGSVTLSWTTGTEGTATINDYLIDIYQNGVKRSTFVLPWRATSFTFRPVTAGVAYSYTVQARNAVGAGPRSALSNSVTPT